MDVASRVLLVLGIGFLWANVRLFAQFIRFLKIRSSALLTWPGRRPPFYGLLLVLGAVLALLIVYKLAVLRQHPIQVFGESMMLLYYAYALLTLMIWWNSSVLWGGQAETFLLFAATGAVCAMGTATERPQPTAHAPAAVAGL